ncbi:endoplasmic reticulum metallopeptidase 1 [Impatiens glandulifera]|uniref:endoplasmic reticulum metallopeptidase 1 n=1 Tax=Impatiens glandulifera TaxID=253017 RepID=UPI001FB09596|nr:endoplasmic reticulum metallopeptidase 1 [Impatiens glandulifera]
MAFGLSSGDGSGVKLLSALAILYGFISLLVYSVLHMNFITPLGIGAPPDRFSEARAIQHVRVLSQDIDGRQVGKQGYKDATQYILTQLQNMKDRAGPNIRVEVEDTIISGSFNMMFLGHNLSLGYRNHTNIIMRISSMDARDSDASVLVNGHFDSPLSSPGAGDCGSCVAAMLEMVRLIVDSGWIPPRPVIFLFNGAEELYMLGSHGFITTHRWRHTIGAFINIEASGTSGPDLICQSGPGSWPSLVYAQSAVYPMANSAAQDVFPVIPGDTDYRMFAYDYGHIPGLDMIFLLGGYFYHTSFDTVERQLPGSLQARGENLFSVIKAFTESSKLRNAFERESINVDVEESDDERAIFFDYLSWFLIIYSKKQAMVLHSIPLAITFFMPVIFRLPKFGVHIWFATVFDIMKGIFFHAVGIILAVVFPMLFSILSLFFTGHSMNWFAHPILAFVRFVPCSVIGLLIPRIIWRRFPLSQDASVIKVSNEELADGAWFWGAFGFYALVTMAYLLAGFNSGFITFCLSVFMLPSWLSFCLSIKFLGHPSLRSVAFYVVPMIPCLTYAAYFGAFLVQFLIEKMGMMGSLPPPYGYFIPDVIVATIVGVVTGWSVGPIMPVVGRWLGKPSIMKFLLHVSVLALAVSSQFFPYSTDAPKRVVFQHAVLTEDGSRIVDSSYEFAVVDSNSLLFVLKHAPLVAKELDISQNLSFESAHFSYQENWMAIYPISFLFSNCMKFPASKYEITKQYPYFPHISSYQTQVVSDKGRRKVYLEFSLGSVKELWVAVLNITGPLTNWSLANNELPAPETFKGGPPSYICRLSGESSDNWTFWLEASSSDAIRVDVAVLDQYLVEPTSKLKGLFPDWMDLTTYTSFISTHVF